MTGEVSVVLHSYQALMFVDSLNVPPPSDRIHREKDFIEATTRLCSFKLTSRPGTPITPIEIRLTKDRLSLVSRVLASNTDAYKHTQVILELVRKLGFDHDVVAEVKTLAMLADTALSSGDFDRAYENSMKLVRVCFIQFAASFSFLPGRSRSRSPGRRVVIVRKTERLLARPFFPVPLGGPIRHGSELLVR